jgi:preprotein translocase subunit SecG
MQTALQMVMIILSIVLIFIVLLQGKGSSFSGGFGGDAGSMHRTRRGFEKTVFQATIVLAFIWTIVAVLTSIVS